MKEELHIALYQQNIAWEDPVANYRMVEEAFAGVGECDIMVVPETFSTGFGDHLARQAEEPSGETYDFAVEMARKHDALFAGTWAVCEDGLVYNRMHLVRPDGSCDTYDKGHTFRMSSEASQLARGQRRVVVEWRGWHIFPAICYDLRFPLWLRNSPQLGYDLLLFSANWPGSRYEAWTTLLKARAIENLSYVVGCNRDGCDSTGINYKGCSAIIDYKGKALAEFQPRDCSQANDNHDSPAILQASLSASKLKTFREHWPFNLDFDNYCSNLRPGDEMNKHKSECSEDIETL